MAKNKFLFLIFLLSSSFNLFAQLKIESLPTNFENLDDSLFLGISKTRNVKSLDGDWKVFLPDSPENAANITVPFKYSLNEIIILEKSFELSGTEIYLNHISLNFLGLNYSAEIFLNNTTIYKHPGGEIPFTIELSEELLYSDRPNTIRVKLQYDIDSKNTIPLLQRFLFPKSYGGILKDVYLNLKPKAGIKKIDHILEDDNRPYEGKLSIIVHLEDLRGFVADSLLPNYNGRFKIHSTLTTNLDTSKIYFNIWNINPLSSDAYDMDFYVRLREVRKWSPESPEYYIVNIKLTNEDGYVYDELSKKISFLEVEKKSGNIFINKNKFNLHGVTYIRSNDNLISNYDQLNSDIKKIKEAGFNTVRFSKTIPHPYLLKICEDYGLFVMIELPLNSVPESFTDDLNFRERTSSFISRAIKFYDNYPNVIAYGAGGSYLSNSVSHLDFLNNFSEVVKANSKNRLSYSSLIGLPNQNELPKTDLIGFELYSEAPFKFIEKYNSKNYSDSVLTFISEATYPTYNGATNGYLNKYSFEGQAKFFDDILRVSNESKLKGFILNSMFEYSGDYTSFFAGNDLNNLYKVGILPVEPNASRLSFNLIKSRLAGGSKVNVPIGNEDDNSPIFFILMALFISVIIALLINSKRKFREDATRALLRPYNFFADIRDQRILSSFHSTILMFLLAGANALLQSILLYFLRDNILLEKIILAFGSYKLSSIISFLAWNPYQSFLYLFIVTIGIIILISILVLMSSFFVKNRVTFSSVFSVLIWAFLPLALFVPIEAILFKVLQLQSFNIVVYVLLIIFFVWNIQRFIKGIYVIFDVRATGVYFFGILFTLIIIAAVGAYLQYTISFYDYIVLAIKQYSLL